MPIKKPVILVVDDEVRILRMMQRILELEGYRVLIANNGEAALAVFDGEAPDLVLLDIMMPGPDGFLVIDRIREESNAPIIMLTAKRDTESIRKAIELGADDFVKKPFRPAELIARINTKLRRL